MCSFNVICCDILICKRIIVIIYAEFYIKKEASIGVAS